MINAHEPAILLRLSLVCALVALRAPVAHSPSVRILFFPIFPIDTIATPTTIPHLCNKPNYHTGEISDFHCRAMSKARVYADVNVLRPKEYWDYESLTVQWGYYLKP